ncbi:NHL repeat-containing protein [Thermococcus gammatolerans]|nr:hypothetical protein [Thermococcus gammatolerans]
MKRMFVFVGLLLILGTLIPAGKVIAEENTHWAKTYRGECEDTARAVAIAPNGDIIVAGYTESFGAGYGDVWVLRLDSEGNVKWQKTYGGSDKDWAAAVAVADNGDVIVAGGTESFGAGKADVWVLRLDENGNVKWQKTYGGKGYDVARSVAIAENGDIIVVGGTESFGAGKADVWVLRLDENGNVKWQKTYGGSSYDWGHAVAITDNGDVIVAGSTDSFGTHEDVLVLRLDTNGNVKWQKTYGGIRGDIAFAVAIAPNGDIIVTGHTKSFGDWDSDVWVLRLDGNGNVKWQKTYGGSSDDDAYSVAIAPNGDIIVVGRTWSFGAGEDDVWVLRLDENGNVEWQKTYGGSDEEEAYAVAVAPNGDIIVAGWNFGADLADVWVLRLPPDGSLSNLPRDSNAPVGDTTVQPGDFNASVKDSQAQVMDSQAVVQDSDATVTTVMSSETTSSTTTTTSPSQITTTTTITATHRTTTTTTHQTTTTHETTTTSKPTTTSSKTTTTPTTSTAPIHTGTTTHKTTTTTTTSEGGGGTHICGPATIVGLVVITAAVSKIRRRKHQ